jgi:hypothetical protein
MLTTIIFFALGVALGVIGLRLLALWEGHSSDKPHVHPLHRRH